MPYTYIYLYIVVLGVIFPLVSLCAHTITHTSMTMMYSVRDTQSSAFRPTQKSLCLSLLFSRHIRRFCAQLEICKFNMQYIPFNSALLAQETVYSTANFEKIPSTICTCIIFARNMRKTDYTKNIVTLSLC